MLRSDNDGGDSGLGKDDDPSKGDDIYFFHLS